MGRMTRSKGPRMVLLPVLTLVIALLGGRRLEAGAEEGANRRTKLAESLRISAYIHARNPSKPLAERRLLVQTLLQEAERLRIPDRYTIDGRPINQVYLLTALINVESSFIREAVSRSDALGYMQLKPTTAAWLDRRLDSDGRLLPRDVAQAREAFAQAGPSPTHDPQLRRQLFRADDNLRRGVAYVNFLVDQHRDLRLVILAYNAGPASVARGVWDENYWIKVLSAYREIEAGRFLATGLRTL